MTRAQLPILVPDRTEAVRRLLTAVKNRTCDLAPALRELDRSEYVDPELFERERTEIFGRYPFVALHGSEIPNPGDFSTVQLPNNEVIFVRQRDGGVRGFVNSCRHRGSRLVTDRSGSRKVFTCAYHGWAYRDDGSLAAVSAEHTFGDLDRSCHGLVQVLVEERHGMVWVVDAVGTQIDVAAWLGPEVDGAFTAYGLADFVSYRSIACDESINWKVFVDAFVDGYHVEFVHPESVAPYFHSNVQIWDPQGVHNRTLAARTSIDDVVGEDPATADVEPHTTVGYNLMPNFMLLRQPDHFELLTFVPGSEVGRCRFEIRILVSQLPTTDKARAYWNKNWDLLVTALRDEDLALIREQQRALGNAGAPPLVFGRNEVVNQRFHEWLDDVLGGKIRT